MDEYLLLINNTFSDLLRQHTKLRLQKHSTQNAIKGKSIITDGKKILETLEAHTRSIKNLLAECQEFIDDIENDLSAELPEEDFVYQTKKGMLSYLGKEYIVKNKKPVLTEKKHTPKPTRVRVPHIGYNMLATAVSDFSQMKPMFYFYNNPSDHKHPIGLYCCVTEGSYVHVPFPKVIDVNKQKDRTKSVRCKYKTVEFCNEQRRKMAEYHDSCVRKCNYAHQGERLVKIGINARCPSNPQFGNSETFSSDIKHVSLQDIKQMLIYGLNDLFSASVYLDCYKHSGVMCNLDHV